MAFDEALAERVRVALSAVKRVEDKRMFGGIAFMVRGKMCVTVGRNRIMCRIDPQLHDDMRKRAGCKTVVMKGRPMRGYLHVAASALKTKRALDFWVSSALRYNATIA